MEVVAEAGAQQPWDQFKEEVEIMEEQNGGGGADAVEELLTREIRRRLDHAHGSSNGDGNHHASGGDEEEEDDASGGDEEDHANGGGEEEAVVEEEEVKVEEQQQRHKSIVFDPAKGLWKCRHCDWTYRLASPCEDGILNHQGYRHQIEWNPKSLVHKEPFYGSLNRVPDIITEVSARYLVTGTMRSGAEKEDSNGTLTPKRKGLEAHENGNGEINHGPSNGKLENGSHSNGSHQVPNDGEPKMEYMFEINKTEIYPTEVDKDGHVTEAQPKVEEYDLEKILDQQETYELFCPNCTSCITRRVILKKRKRTVRTTPTDEPSKRPYIEGQVPPVTLPDRVEEESPDVFRCLSCFSFFIPTGCSFNIFRIFGRRGVDGQPDVLPPPASEDTPPRSENCTSWLLSCFQTGDSPYQPHPADPMTVPLLPGNTTTVTESQSSTSHVYHSQGTVVKPEHPTVESPSENQADPADSPRTPSLPGMATPGGVTTTTTETNESHVQHSHGTQQLTVDSSSQHQKTTTTVEDNETTTTVTSEKNTTSSKSTTGAPSASPQTSSSTEYFKQDVSEVVTGKMPSGGAIMDPTHPQISYKGFTPRGDIPTSSNPQPANPDHVVVPVLGGVNQVAPRQQQRDDWDILKAIVYGGLVESVTSLSVVSAAASSGAKTLDIFILGIANLIGGLPLIFHNIADLRDIRDVDGNDEQVGHYWLQLGKRSKARLHMVMALLSYMVFGLLPPVLYGLSFRESNDRENKMMAVAGASLACIALLALGKAHVHTRTYFKTLMYYLMIAVSSSGLSYVAGVLITRLLVQYGIIEQGGSARAPPGLSSRFAYAAGAESSAWASF
ncbi:membrane protein of ER body-like protein isoform X2 [Triticum aestivum]|uniref:membrane protein of ER body-like protein isoform X2 n=1 Tax=Triticum aestivum TaxID=4565 RepID=UPI000843F482|nr:membrane protein of ER body-like protein isoform X2 [Triticum aestivum]